jgi:hypothetical protein
MLATPLHEVLALACAWLLIGTLGLARTGIRTERPRQLDAALRAMAPRLSDEVLAWLGRALAIRHVDAGSCNGCDGGIFGENYASRGRVANVLLVDVAVPGCSPQPDAVIQGILTAVSAAKGSG